MNTKRQEAIKLLKEFTYPYSVEKVIRSRLEKIEVSKDRQKMRQPHFCYKRLEIYENNVKHLEKIREGRRNKNNKIKIRSKIPKTEKEIKELAYRTAIYFHQGYEMFKTAIDMDIISSPILEYYALLQIVKGVIMLELDVDKKDFFGAHGLKQKKDPLQGIIHQAKPKTHGVFAALVIRCTNYSEDDETGEIKNYEIEHYYNDYFPTFKELIKSIRLSFIPETFIFSWMLSEIARYKPEEWKSICDGIDNDWIIHINRFREETYPEVIRSLLTSHIE